MTVGSLPAKQAAGLVRRRMSGAGWSGWVGWLLDLSGHTSGSCNRSPTFSMKEYKAGEDQHQDDAGEDIRKNTRPDAEPILHHCRIIRLRPTRSQLLAVQFPVPNSVSVIGQIGTPWR